MPGIMVEGRKSWLHNVCCRNVFMRASIMPGHNAHNHLLSKGTRKSTMNLVSYIIIINITRWGQRFEKAKSGVWEKSNCDSPPSSNHPAASPNIGNTFQMTHRENERDGKG